MGTPLNIIWDEETLNSKGALIEEKLNNALGDVVKTENLKLQQAAIQFLQQTSKVVNDINDYNNLQKTQAQLREKMKQQVPVDPALNNLYEQTADMIRERFVEQRVFDNFFKASMIFNDRVLEIITGAPMTTVIMVDGADGPEVREYTIQELLEAGSGVNFIVDYTSKSYTLMGRIRINTSQLTQAVTKISEQEQQKHNFSLIGLNQAYAEAKKDYLKHSPNAFFKEFGEKVWQKIKVAGGLGDISEAYTGFFFLKKPPFKDHPFTNLAVYFRQGVANVDSVSGLYAADIQDLENKRNYAIKAASASLPGYVQMIRLANNILNKTKHWDVAKLRQISEQKQYKIVNGEKIRKGLRNKVEDAFDFVSEIMTD